MNIDRLKASIRTHEGFRAKPYKCTSGRLTIGYGRNLEDRGISMSEAEFLLTHDVNRLHADLRHIFPSFSKLTSLRQEVILEMAFQLGIGGLLKFKKFINHIRLGAWDRAADEMLDSRWAVQTTARAEELSRRFRRGA